MNYEIESLVSAAKYVYREDPKKERRFRNVVWGRMAIFQILTENKMSLTKAGDVFGKDHATVLNAVRKHKAYYGSDEDYTFLYNAFLNRIGKQPEKVIQKTIAIKNGSNQCDEIVKMIQGIPEELCESLLPKIQAVINMAVAVHNRQKKLA